MPYRSNLERVLKEERFAVTAEIGPPKGTDSTEITQKAGLLNGYADAFNITDNQAAVVRFSSLAGCCLLLQMKMEPILQITCRDRNRIALQSDILGAAGLGVRNILCLTGDHQLLGNHPDARGVYDVDSIQLIQILKTMRDHGRFQNGDPILKGNPDVYIGAAINPFADPIDLHLDRLDKKIRAGADFIQTQSVFNMQRFITWMDAVRSRGLDKKVPILAGVTPLKSLKMAQRMKNHIPGVDVPDFIETHMKQATDPKQQGCTIALETIAGIKKINGIRGIHITALFWEEIIPLLICQSGLHPRV